MEGTKERAMLNDSWTYGGFTSKPVEVEEAFEPVSEAAPAKAVTKPRRKTKSATDATTAPPARPLRADATDDQDEA
jgi:hypothetical protein